MIDFLLQVSFFDGFMIFVFGFPFFCFFYFVVFFLVPRIISFFTGDGKSGV